MQGEDLTFRVPALFSIIDNPESTLRFINTVSGALDNAEVRSINLDHSGLKDHDLAAEILLGVAAKEIKTVFGYRNINVLIRGNYPDSERQTRLIRSMGVVKKLNIEKSIESSDLAALEIFDFRGIKDTEARLGEDRKNRCARTFVEHVNACLYHAGRQLTSDAVQDLTDFIGEILANAEDHSGENRWYVCGYLDDDKQLGSNEVRFCEIAIFNFGRSIAETFMELDSKSYALSVVKPYVDQHLRQGFFGRNWYKDDLLTLVALQGHVSSKNDGIKYTDRGQGTIDLIRFFQRVAGECSTIGIRDAKMALVSGSTHILFDEKYQIQKTANGRDVIAFNASNDLNIRPDSKYVTHLEGVKFPGTLIGIKFPLRADDTEAVTPEVDSENEQSK